MLGKTAERSMTLYELLGKMQPHARRDEFLFADFWTVMEKRGFGPMLALPSFIACTPIGAIPGIPSLRVRRYYSSLCKYYSVVVTLGYRKG